MVRWFTTLSQKTPQKNLLFFVLYYQQKTGQANKCVNFIQKAPQKELVILRLMGVVLRKGQVGILIVSNIKYLRR
jgi:hypothetical protein